MATKVEYYNYLQRTLKEKVDFLSQPQHYPQTSRDVIVVETHMAWIFLTEKFAYKLKKPIFYPHQDFSTIDARYRDHKLELTLNRRFASDIYLNLVPLTVNADNQFLIGSSQAPCDWLLKMHRLPNQVCMEELARLGAVKYGHGTIIGQFLGEFYRMAAPIQIDVFEYKNRFLRNIDENLTVLADLGQSTQQRAMQKLCREQKAFIESRSNLFAECLYQRRVIEGHGDLRPEHIFFNAGLRIIDCLEFFRDLRLLDYFDDIAFLALECDRLGLSEIGNQVIEVVADICTQTPPWTMIQFYKSYRAAIRAKLAILHLRDHFNGDEKKWVAITDEYLSLAQANIDLALKKQ